MPHADRINSTLDHVFGRVPGVTSTERNRDVLRLLAEELNRMHQLRKVKTINRAANYSPSNPTNDMVPALQWMGDWQPETSFHQEYMNTPLHTPNDIDSWWNYPNPHVMPEYSPNEGLWGEDFGVPNRIY